jgi:Mn2+/Fe2+ NRAMP family transporter
VWVILFANIIKYPFYKISPIYTSLTNKSLIHAYRKQGKWAVYLFLLLTLSTMFIIQSAITVVTSGLFAEVLGIDLSLIYQSLILLSFSSALILIGKFNILDDFVKFIIIILTITTGITVFSALTYTPTSTVSVPKFSFLNKADIFFFIALIGWMPAPMDIPVWQSMWTLAKNKKNAINVKDALLDFNVGFVATALLAIAFLTLGALIMHPTGEEFSSSAIVFSKQLISLYTGALGDWSYYLISIAACTTMFSTTITCLDAFGRITSESFKELGNQSLLAKRELWVIITALGAFLILQFYIANMRDLVDLATTISFLAAPLYAILNFNVIKDKIIPKEYRYNKFEYILCYFGLLFFTLFSLYYVWVKFMKVE